MDNRFATWLQPAMADFDEEYLKKRWAAVESLSKELEHGDIMALVRFCSQVGEADQDVVSKLRDSIFKHDNTFIIGGNDLELRLLSSVIVIKILSDNDVNSLDYALFVTCLHFGGLHTGFELPDLVNLAYESLNTLSIELRSTDPLPTPQERLVNSAHIMKPLKEKMEQDQPHLMIADFEPVFTDVAKSVNQLATANSNLQTALELQKEEVNVLWWLVGAHSNDLKQPFSDLPRQVAAVVAGKELASLVSYRPGPLGVASILSRMIANTSGKSTDTSMQELVSQIPIDWRKQTSNALPDLSEMFCPLISAIAASSELDDSEDWIKLFQKHFPHNVEVIASLDIYAMQMYREWMLILESETWG